MTRIAHCTYIVIVTRVRVVVGGTALGRIAGVVGAQVFIVTYDQSTLANTLFAGIVLGTCVAIITLIRICAKYTIARITLFVGT